ncbi:MAG: hypothetical protein WDN25_30945 [Acetobacteraceae bacterium]
MADEDGPDPQFDAMTARLLRREALRRAAAELNTMTGPGLEQALARISTEVTEEAAVRHAAAVGHIAGQVDALHPPAPRKDAHPPAPGQDARPLPKT